MPVVEGETPVERQQVARRGLGKIPDVEEISVAVMTNPGELMTCLVVGESPVVLMTNPAVEGVPVVVITNPAVGEIPHSTHGKEYSLGKLAMAVEK